MSSPSPLRLDLPEAQCLSLELHFVLDLPEDTRRELALLGSREAEEEELVYFHEDYRNPSAAGEGQKLHSWAEVHLVGSGESDVLVEYLVESELEDQSELHHTDFTLSHLFNALAPITQEVAASFTLRFDLGNEVTLPFLRLLHYDVGIEGRYSVEYRGAHLRVKSLFGDEYDMWFDLRSDDSVEATLRFTLTERPTVALPGHGLAYGRQALSRLLGS